MGLSELPQLVRNTGRLREVIGVLGKYGLADWLHATQLQWVRKLLKPTHVAELGDVRREARIRMALEELGTTFVKLGQVLSTRPDLVGPELADELAKLQSSTPPDPPEAVETLIEKELGQPPSELFREFGTEPLASASIGQIHRAELPDGRPVVVKVQHVGIEERVSNDLEILGKLAELAERYASLRPYRPVQTAEDMSRTLLLELDFRSEAKNLERFRRNFGGDPGVRFPEPFPRFSTKRVLTMERFRGISVADEPGLRASGCDLEEIARRGAAVFVSMIFRDGFYHADPHPGNLMVLPDGAAPEGGVQAVIGIIDCGMIGRLDEALRSDIERALVAALRGDVDDIVDVIARQGSLPNDFDPSELRLDVEAFVGDYAHMSLQEFDLGGCLQEFIRIIRRHGIVLPARLGMLLKVLIMLEGTAQKLSPTFSLAELLQPYGRKRLSSRLSPAQLLATAGRRYRDWDRLVDVFPREAADILHRVKQGSFDVNLIHRRLEVSVNRLVLGVLAAALFMGSTSLLSQGVPPRAWGVSLPGGVGAFVACWLGYSLIRAIRADGRPGNR